jgi:hypothetical protein
MASIIAERFTERNYHVPPGRVRGSESGAFVWGNLKNHQARQGLEYHSTSFGVEFFTPIVVFGVTTLTGDSDLNDTLGGASARGETGAELRLGRHG